MNEAALISFRQTAQTHDAVQLEQTERRVQPLGNRYRELAQQDCIMATRENQAINFKIHLMAQVYQHSVNFSSKLSAEKLRECHNTVAYVETRLKWMIADCLSVP